MDLFHYISYFELASGAGVGEVEVVIMDPAGKKNTVTCSIEDKGNSSYRCTYKPTLEGQHTIYVTFAGGQISRSPFTVNVGEGKSHIFDFLAPSVFLIYYSDTDNHCCR